MDLSDAKISQQLCEIDSKEKGLNSSEVEQLGGWKEDCDTPNSSRRDALSSPFVATPSAPSQPWRDNRVHQQFCKSAAIRCVGSPIYCDDKRGSPLLTHGTKVIDAFDKDLLVIALEEENERLRSALDAERRARQVAESEAAAQEGRACGLEQQAQKLSMELAEAREKLAALEQEAFSRALVQAWLDTTAIHRCGSIPGPEDDTGGEIGSPVYAEAMLSMQSQPSGRKPSDGTDVGVKTAHVSLHTEPSLQPSSLDAGTCDVFRHRPANTPGQMGDGVGDEMTAYRDRDPPLPYGADVVEVPVREQQPISGRSGSYRIPRSPHTAACAAAEHIGIGGVGTEEGGSPCGCICISYESTPLPPAYGVHHLSRRTATGGAADATRHAVGSPMQRACLGVDGDRGGGAGPCPLAAWSPSPNGGPSVQSPLPSAQALLLPGGGGIEPACGEQAIAFVSNVCKSAGRPLNIGWSPDGAQGGPGLPTLRLSATRSATTRPATAFAELQHHLAAAYSAPTGSYRCGPHPHTAPWPSGSLRVADRSRLLRAGGSALLRGASDAGGCDSGGGGGSVGVVPSVVGIAPVGCAQDGGEWCNIPLGSPVCTPKKGGARPAQSHV